MAVIKVMDGYEIKINKYRNIKARKFIKENITENNDKIPLYRTIGNYSTIPNALNAIYKDMCYEKADEKESVTLDEFVHILKEKEKLFTDVISKIDFSIVDNT